MRIYFSLSTLQGKRHVAALAFGRTLVTLMPMPERTQKPAGPAPWERKQGDGDGPKSPDVQKPDTRSILERMRKVDPDQARRYRQRTGQ
jgi:hypothetical protein